jgi:acyl-CoA thioester hydrolase
MAAMSEVLPFRYLLRVRYGECDAQGIVFNARWADYIDIATSEYSRALFGSVDPRVTGIDWKLVRQTIEWKASGRYDEVIDVRIRPVRIGTTSFTLGFEIARWPDGAVLVTAETVFVAVDPVAGTKQAISGAHRHKFDAGAPGVIIDHAAALGLSNRA